MPNLLNAPQQALSRLRQLCALGLGLSFLLTILGTGKAANAESSRPLFDHEFEPQSWNAQEGEWSGDLEKWQAERARGEAYLHNFGGTGSTLNRALEVAVGEPVAAVLTYGWRFGNGGASAELELGAKGDKALLLRISQKPGPEKYELFLRENDEQTSLGNLSDDTDDRGVAMGGRIAAGTVALRYDPAGKVMIHRLGGSSETFEVPADLHLRQLTVRDASPGNEQLRLVRLRAFTGEADPVLTDVKLQLPFGGCFVEGATPELAVSAAWAGSGARALRLEGTITAFRGDQESRPIESEGRLEPGQALKLDTAAMKDLPPGLYELKGTLHGDDMAEPQPITGRFGILSAELASRPSSEIPGWVGIVPYLNVLPREQFEPAFAFLDQIGVRHVRWLPGWGRVEPQRDQYDWSESDLFMALCERYGIDAMFCLSYYGADWSNRAAGGQMARSQQGRELWVEHFAVPTIKRYGDRVKLWQIWNEPDAFWNEDPKKARGFATGFGTPANYYDLLVRTHKAGHALGMEDLRIVASLSSADAQDGLELLFGFGLADHFDGLIIHTYGNHLGHFRKTRDLLAEYGFPDAPIGSGEIGIPTGPDRDAELRQGVKVARVMLSSTAIESPLLCIDWFVLHDLVAGGQFGLLDANLQPQPGALAYATVSRLLAGATRGQVQRRGNMEMFRVDRDGRPPLVGLFGSGSTTRVALRVTGDATPVAWDLSGQSRRLDVRDGTTEVDLIDDVILIEGDVVPQFEVTASVAPALTQDGTPAVRVRMESELSETKQVEVAVRSEALGLDEQREVTLEPGTTELSAELLEVEAGRQYEVEVEARWPGGLAAVHQQVEFTPIVQVTPQQAQSPRRPEGVAPIRLDQAEQATPFGGQEWGGPADNSAELAFGWTPEHLVLWVAQRDDTHMPINETNPWGYDGPQLAIDPTGERTTASPRVEVNFGISPQGPLAFVSQQPHYQPELEAEREGEMTYYRLLMPLSQLQVDAEPGQAIGIALIINDNDGQGRKGWLGFGGGIAEEKNPARYRQLIFTGPSGVAVKNN